MPPMVSRAVCPANEGIETRDRERRRLACQVGPRGLPR